MANTFIRCVLYFLAEKPAISQPVAIKSIINLDRKDPLSAEEIEQVSQYIQQYIKQHGLTAEIKPILQRLRDYYKMTSFPGNHKTASTMLLASLAHLREY